MQRVDVFVLGGQVHGANANEVNIRVLEHLLSLHTAQISVKDRHGKEVGARCALERGRYFNHPVDHLRAVLFTDVVMLKRRVWGNGIGSNQVLVDLSEERELVVLALLRSRLLCAQSEALVALLVRLDGACVAGAAPLHQDNVPHWVVVVQQFLSVARAARNATLQSDWDSLLLELMLLVVVIFVLD